MSTKFTPSSFFIRFIFALLLVCATYNPSGYSWVHWLASESPLVYKAAAGMFLLIGWVIYLRATWNSLGAIGTILATSFFAILVWLLIEWEILSLDQVGVMQWILLIIVAAVLAIGMSWSHIRRRMSGQYDTDEIEG